MDRPQGMKMKEKEQYFWEVMRERVKTRVPSHTSNEVPQVESFVPLDALVGNLACVVNAERQTDQSEANGHQQEEDHHHVKATVQCSHKLWENWTEMEKHTYYHPREQETEKTHIGGYQLMLLLTASRKSDGED